MTFITRKKKTADWQEARRFLRSPSAHWCTVGVFGIYILLVSALFGQAQVGPASTASKSPHPVSPASASNSNDLRLVAVAKARDWEAVRLLLQRHADVNVSEGDGTTALAWAVHWEASEAVDLLIRSGAWVNAANDYNVTPLSLACSDGSAAMVEKLLVAGADANVARSSGETPLMRCARTGMVEAVKLLLAHGAQVNAKETQAGQTALMWALALKRQEIVRILIENGADVRARSQSGFTPLMFAAQQGDLESAKLLLAAGADVNASMPDGANALMAAVVNSQEALSIFLLEKGANPNVRDGHGITPLHYAVMKGLSMAVGVQLHPFNLHVFPSNMPEAVKALLAHGADPNARIVKAPLELRHAHNTVQREGLSIGATPFLLAAFTLDVGIMRMMAAVGANPKLTTDDGVTPLMVAAGVGRRGGNFDAKRWRDAGQLQMTDELFENSSLDAVKLLLEMGCDIDVTDKNGQTALFAAAKDGSVSMIQLLAERGANLNLRDKFGQTPLSMAEGLVPAGAVDITLVNSVVHKRAAELLAKLGAMSQPLGEQDSKAQVQQ